MCDLHREPVYRCECTNLLVIFGLIFVVLLLQFFVCGLRCDLP